MRTRKLIQTLPLAIALAGFASASLAETYEVQMLNKGEDGMMVFEPDFVHIQAGDTVKFVATDKAHNAESIPDMMPEGAEPFKGKINEEIEVTFDQDGLYGVKCSPHFAMGMAMTVAVGDVSEVPADYLEGRIPPKAKERIEAQLEELKAMDKDMTDDMDKEEDMAEEAKSE